MTIRTRNLILTIVCLGLVAFALRTDGLSDTTRTALIAATFAFITGLWMHSGRPPGGGLAAVTLACAAQLAYGCDQGVIDYCAVGHVTRGPAPAVAPAAPRVQLGTLQVPGDLDVLGGANADYVRFTAQAATPAACATPYGCSFYSSVDGLIHQTNAAGTDYASGTAHRARIVAGTPGDVATSWIWHDSAAGYLMWRSPTGSIVIGAATGMPFTAPVITGGMTVSGLASFTGDVTLGDAAADIILNKGTWRLENTANTFYVALTHAATANRAVTLPDAAGEITLIAATQELDNKTIDAQVVKNGLTASGSASNNFSGSTGDFAFPTGAVSWTGAAAKAFALVASGAAINLTADAASVWKTLTGDLRVDAAGVLNLGTADATGTNVGRSGQATDLLGTVKVNSAPTAATFFKTCTISSASASVAINCLAAADVPAALSAKLATWHAYVNGATAWGTTATCTIEDTAGNDLVTIAVAALTGDTFIDDGSANVTKESRYRLGTGGAVDAGLQIICDANGTGSDLVFVLSGSVQ